MLRKETVTPGTLELLKKLMQEKSLDDFFLAGGTALSLQIGHRISIDIDLFSRNPFDENNLSVYLETEKGMRLNYLNRNTIKGQIDNIQVDLITHTYPLVNEIQIDETIRLASLEDIAAMKLNAIIGNGTRLKDFVDVAFLSSHLSLGQMVHAYEKKYQSRNAAIAMKALAYHNEINFSEPVRFLSGKYSWKPIDTRLNQMIKFTDKIFPPLSFK